MQLVAEQWQMSGGTGIRLHFHATTDATASNSLSNAAAIGPGGDRGFRSKATESI